MRFLSRLLICALLSLVAADLRQKIKYRRYNDVLKSIVPVEIIDFYHNMTKEELRTYREVKRELFRAHLNGSELSDQQIGAFIEERSPSLLAKKNNVENALDAKISALTSNAQLFIRSLNVTNVFKPKFECDARRQCMAALKSRYVSLSDSDKLAVVEKFPNFQRVFAWLMRFSGPSDATHAVASSKPDPQQNLIGNGVSL